MSASMAEGMAALVRKAMLDHRVVWELDPDGETLVARCDSCAYLCSELETFEHQANIAAGVLAANGYGKLGLEAGIWTMTDAEFKAELEKARIEAAAAVANAVRSHLIELVNALKFTATGGRDGG